MKTPINTGGPAFAAATCGDWQIGMTIRDVFAGLALAGFCANHEHMDSLDDSDEGVARLATHAHKIADAMIAARNQTEA